MYLFFPLIIAFTIIQLTILLSPQQKHWSRIIIVFTFLFFCLRYFWWRSFFTLNFDTSINAIFSVFLLILEIVFILIPTLQILCLLKVKSRKKEADRMSEAVKNSIYQPTVDIFIPTYNEPLSVVKRTIVGCQLMEYDRKKIYLLDDGNREEFKQLCVELKCDYITRENPLHAKAGNLNHALTKTTGELIVIFDADFIPTTNFLTRTIGFFQNKKIGLLQTYQSFYSDDPILNNLGLANKIPTEVDIFSRYYQRIRDSLHTALCYGSSFVVRRKSLEEIGGFVINSLSEDYHTGIKLASNKYDVIYLEESLSAGLSPENISGYIRQKKRWARGTIQSLFIPENPLFISGLKWWQRLAHLEGIVQWFLSPLRLILLILPLFFSLFNIIPLQTNIDDIIYFFLPFYIIQITTFPWLNFNSRSILISEIYNLVTAIPLSIEIWQTLINPFNTNFKVTPKGIKKDNYYFNWSVATPLFFLLIINLFNLYKLLHLSIDKINYINSIHIIIYWSVYNTILIILAIIALLEIPKPDSYQWLEVKKKVKVTGGENNYKGEIIKMSEIGAEIAFSSLITIPQQGKLIMEEEGLILEYETQVEVKKKSIIKVTFINLSLSQYREIIKVLFCQPNTWKQKVNSSEIYTILLLIKGLYLNLSSMPKIIGKDKKKAKSQRDRETLETRRLGK